MTQLKAELTSLAASLAKQRASLGDELKQAAAAAAGAGGAGGGDEQWAALANSLEVSMSTTDDMLKAKIAGLEQEAMADRKSSSERLSDVGSRVDGLSVAAAAADRALASVRANVSALGARADAARNASSASSAQVARLERELGAAAATGLETVANLRKMAKAVDASIETVGAETDKKLAAVQRATGAAASGQGPQQASLNQTELDVFNANFAFLGGAVKALEANVSRLHGADEAVADQMSALGTALAAAKDDLGRLKQADTTVADQIAAHGTALAASTDDLARLKNADAAIADQIAAHGTALAASTDDLARLKKTDASVADQISAHATSIAAAERKRRSVDSWIREEIARATAALNASAAPPQAGEQTAAAGGAVRELQRQLMELNAQVLTADGLSLKKAELQKVLSTVAKLSTDVGNLGAAASGSLEDVAELKAARATVRAAAATAGDQAADSALMLTQFENSSTHAFKHMADSFYAVLSGVSQDMQGMQSNASAAATTLAGLQTALAAARSEVTSVNQAQEATRREVTGLKAQDAKLLAEDAAAAQRHGASRALSADERKKNGIAVAQLRTELKALQASLEKQRASLGDELQRAAGSGGGGEQWAALAKNLEASMSTTDDMLKAKIAGLEAAAKADRKAAAAQLAGMSMQLAASSAAAAAADQALVGVQANVSGLRASLEATSAAARLAAAAAAAKLAAAAAAAAATTDAEKTSGSSAAAAGMGELRAALSEVALQLKQLKQADAAVADQVSAHGTALAASKDDLARLKNSEATVADQIAAHGTALAASKDDLGRLKQADATVSDQIAAHGTALAGQQDAMARVRSTLTGLMEKAGPALRNRSALNAQLQRRLTVGLSSLEDRLRLQASNASQGIELLKTALVKAGSAWDSLEKSVTALQKRPPVQAGAADAGAPTSDSDGGVGNLDSELHNVRSDISEQVRTPAVAPAFLILSRP